MQQICSIKIICTLMSVFGSAYLYRKTFSKMKYIKSHYRLELTDEHLQANLMIGNSNFEP